MAPDQPSLATDLRFRAGDRVRCNMGRGGWTPGVVVKLHYREDHWPAAKVAPYQVQLDSGDLIFAPSDVSVVIRAEDDEVPGTPSLPAGASLDDDGTVHGCDSAAARSALEALQSEMAAVRALPFVKAAETPRAFGVAELAGRLFTPSESTGPWLVAVLLRGPPGSAYAGTHRVHLKCNAAWPRSPAEVVFTGTLLHPLITDGGLVEAEALAEVEEVVEEPSPEDPPHSLCRTLRALNLLLTRADALMPDTAQSMMRQMMAHCMKRQDLIGTYSAARRHSRLFDADKGWFREWFDPAFLSALDANTEVTWRSFVKEEAWQVYSFPLFTLDFCDMYIEELYSFYATGLPARRPNSMNNYGIIVNEIGLEEMNDRLQAEYLQPLAHALFPGAGSHFGHQHSFVVRYKVGEDLGLDMHTDDSDVTFNICLGKDFKGAGLQFCGNQATAEHRKASAVYHHVRGRCVVHMGHRRHGADDITDGERLNLIFWNSNPEYRRSNLFARYHTQSASTYDKEIGPPDKVCVSFTHDRDYGLFQEYDAKSLKHKGRGWCPPSHAEYDGFVGEARSPGRSTEDESD
eukprot:TRINITY_DN26428_c1_g2_i1.p1 TRINITY_DN26428_c1_g2~~TRINITY_DN26428_c1_g2_i1.p1  ORF type:complete len:574 (-),score=79.45 TRINITY_DN26428_c1_g2_i1:48-1769(-)